MVSIVPSPAPVFVELVTPKMAHAHVRLVTMDTSVTGLVAVGGMELGAVWDVSVRMELCVIMYWGSVDVPLAGLGGHVSTRAMQFLSFLACLEPVVHKGMYSPLRANGIFF